MNLFKKFWRPLTFYKRDHDFYQRHAQGDISSRDIIEIEYGGAMPKGWTVEDKAHQHTPVAIITPLTDKKTPLLMRGLMMVAALGYVHRDPGAPVDISPNPYGQHPAIALNKLIFSPVGQGGLLYLGYTMALTIGTLAMALSPTAIIRRYPLLFLMTISSLRNQPLTQLLTLPFRPAMDTIGHENIHVLQNRDPHETRTGYNIFRNSFKARYNQAASGATIRGIEPYITLGMSSYFRNDYEIQARMNTLLTHNYARWGRMPETKHEFWAAMIDAGLRAPKAVFDELYKSGEDLSDFNTRGTVNRFSQQLTAPHIAELNAGYWALYSKDSKEDFWFNALPYMYGHLTELCGDERGLEKMGYTGPVLNDAGPVPLLPWSRIEYWKNVKSDFVGAAKHIKEVESVRGLYLRDSFPGDPMMNDSMKEVEKFVPNIAALRKTTHKGAGYINLRAP